jgi:hypothetical protein
MIINGSFIMPDKSEDDLNRFQIKIYFVATTPLFKKIFNTKKALKFSI